MRRELPDSALVYVLKGLIPYTPANLKLAFKPSLFFADLEKIARKKQRTLQNAYYVAIKSGLIELDDDNIPRLTTKGRKRIRRFEAKKLDKHARLMVIFDIPEDEAWKRQRLRRLLHETGFKQIQKSVWTSEYDHRELLLAEIKQYHLEPFLQLYEAARIYP